MELFLFRHEEYERLYNCTGFVIDAIPLEKRRRFVPESILNIILCAVFYILYIPCMFSIWKHRRESTCYQLLFFIGLMDLAILWILGFLHSFLSLTGSMFCSRPTLMYFTGVTASIGWIVESSADLLLAFERCLEIIAPHVTEFLFHGRRIAIWIGICCAYGLYWGFFEHPVLFNGIYFAWFFNPFEGYREDVQGMFNAKLHVVHDYAIAILMPTIYMVFALWIRFKMTADRNISVNQRMAFLQVFAFSAMNTGCCSIYVIIQYVEPRQWMITFAQFSWLFIHGFPPVIYLLLNKTIRYDVTKMFFKVFNPGRISSLHGITVLVRGGQHQQGRVQPAVVGGGIVAASAPE